MKKLVLLLVVVGVVTSACGSLGPTAATVNGSRISQEAIDEELEAIGANTEYRAAIEPQVGGAILGAGSGTFSSAFAAQVLTRQIFFELVRQEVERRDLDVGREALELARGQAEEQVGGEEIFRGFSASYRETLVNHFARVNVLREALTAEAVEEAGIPDPRAYYRANPEEFVELCTSHVLVETREAADAARARLQAGEDFGTVATQASTDPSAAQNRGELPCGRAGTYVPEFEAAARELEAGQISEPVQTDFGFHVILLRAKRTVPFEEVAEELEAQLSNQAQQQSQNALDEFLREAVAEAEVDVNPKYGRWVTGEEEQQPHVEPPGVPEAIDPEANELAPFPERPEG